jgi:hypothetical protein
MPLPMTVAPSPVSIYAAQIRSSLSAGSSSLLVNGRSDRTQPGVNAVDEPFEQTHQYKAAKIFAASLATLAFEADLLLTTAQTYTTLISLDEKVKGDLYFTIAIVTCTASSLSLPIIGFSCLSYPQSASNGTYQSRAQELRKASFISALSGISILIAISSTQALLVEKTKEETQNILLSLSGMTLFSRALSSFLYSHSASKLLVQIAYTPFRQSYKNLIQGLSYVTALLLTFTTLTWTLINPLSLIYSADVRELESPFKNVGLTYMSFFVMQLISMSSLLIGIIAWKGSQTQLQAKKGLNLMMFGALHTSLSWLGFLLLQPISRRDEIVSSSITQMAISSYTACISTPFLLAAALSFIPAYYYGEKALLFPTDQEELAHDDAPILTEQSRLLP